MGVISDLVRAVAQVEGLDEVSVGVYARHAREAGFITNQGRGRHAAKMSLTDAANLLIAVNASTLAKTVPETIERYRKLKIESEPFSLDPLGALVENADQDFGSALEQAIRWCIRDTEGHCEMRRVLDTSHFSSEQRFAKKEKIELRPASFTLMFHHPYPAAEMQIRVPLYRKEGRKIIEWESDRSRLPFISEGLPDDLPDRRNTTIITHRTLMRVADVLQS